MKDILTNIGVSAIVAVLVVMVFGAGSNDPVSIDLGGTRFPNGISADSTSPTSGQVRGTTLLSTGAVTLQSTLGVTGAILASSTLQVTGNSIFYGSLNGLRSASTTDGVAHAITAAECGKITFLKGTGATITLPAASEGCVQKFVTSELFSTNFVIAAASDEFIDGSLTATTSSEVACANETAINIIAASDTLSDFVELTATSTSGWLITDSYARKIGGFTCTGG